MKRDGKQVLSDDKEVNPTSRHSSPDSQDSSSSRHSSLVTFNSSSGDSSSSSRHSSLVTFNSSSGDSSSSSRHSSLVTFNSSSSSLPILVVEDEPGLNRLLCRRLEKEGWQASGVLSGAEAIEHAQASDLLLLLDYTLPDMNGRAVVERLIAAGHEVPFIIMTGRGDERTAVEMMKLGARDYVTKEFDFIDRLVECIHGVRRELAVEAELARSEKRGRREREIARLEAERWLRTFNALADPVCLLDANQRFLQCNEAMEQLLGRGISELVGKPCCEVVHGTKEPPENCPLERMKASRRRETAEVTLADRAFRVTVDPMFAPDGTLDGAVHVMNDITAAKRAEENLRASEERFRRVFENVSDAILVLTPDGRVRYTNPAAGRTFGLESEALAGRHLFEMVHPDDAPAVIRAFGESARTTETPARVECRIPRADGTERFADLVCDNLLGLDSPAGIVVTVRDITERKRADSALRESEEKFRGLAEATPDHVMLLDRELTIRYVNFASPGLTVEQLTGTPLPGYAPPGREDEIRALLEGVLRTGALATYETDYPNPDGSSIHYESRAARLGTDNIVVVARDITDRRRAEEQLVMRASELETIADTVQRISACATAEDVCRVLGAKVSEVSDGAPAVVTLYDPDAQALRLVSHHGFGERLDAVLTAAGRGLDELIIPPAVPDPARLADCTDNRLHPAPDAMRELLGGEVPEAACRQAAALLDVADAWHAGFSLDRQPRGGVTLLLPAGRTPAHTEVIETLVSHAAVTIRRRWAEDELRRRTDDLELVGVVNDAVNRGAGFEEIVAILNERARAMFHGQAVTLYLVSADRSALVMQNAGLEDGVLAKVEGIIKRALPPVTISIEDGGLHTEVLNGSTLRVFDDPKDIHRLAEEHAPTDILRRLAGRVMKALALRTVLLTPVIAESRPLGLLSVSSRIGFSAGEVERFRLIALQLSVALARKMLTDAIRQGEEEYRLVFDNAGDAIIVTSEGRIAMANPRAGELTGVPREEMLGRPLADFIRPDDAALVADRHRRRIDGEDVPNRYELRILRRDGEARLVEFHPVLIDWQGHAATLSFLADVTERRELERRQEEHAAELKLLNDIDNSINRGEPLADTVRALRAGAAGLFKGWSTDIYVADDKGRFVLQPTGMSAENLSGLEKLIGGRVPDIVITETPDSLFFDVLRSRQVRNLAKPADIARFMRECAPSPVYHPLVTAGRKLLKMNNVVLAPLVTAGRPLGMLVVSGEEQLTPDHLARLERITTQVAIAVARQMDFTELERHREHLEELVAARTRELELAQGELLRSERLAALGRVAGSVAHEIRNPLGSIRNATYYLRMTSRDKLAGRPARHLDIIDDEITRANKVITSLLAFARGRAPAPCPCALQDIIAVALREADLPDTIRLERDITPGLPTLIADATQLIRVFTNLLTNARQSMADDGTITITARADGEHIRVAIADSGTGIIPEHLPKLFEPLFSTRAVGVGLGLAISRAHVEAHGGTIEVKSEPGHGSTFTVVLPCPRP